MASISLGQWNAYNTSYGCYNTYFEYDGTSRSGTTITVTNASVYCVRVGTGYTTNRGATSGSIGGQNGWSNAQLWASGTQSPATCRYTRGTVNVTGVDYTTSTISVNVQCRGASASNWNTIYGTVQLNSTFNISVPVINPPSYNSIASSSVTTNSAYLSASVNTNGVSITGGGWDISTDGGSTWTYHDGNPTGATISGLTPGTKYWYRGYVTTEAGSANSGWGWGYFRTLQDSVAIVNPLIENLDNNDCSLSVYSSPFYGMDRAVLDIYDENKSQIVGNCGIRYIKIGSEGSTTNAWNHIVECYVYANFLKGQKIAGVTVGGDYTGYIAVNSNNGTDNSNVGDFYTYAGTFTHPNGNTFVQSSNYEVNSNFEGSTPAIDGFLMFIGSDISRFSSVLHPGASFVVAKYFSGQWYYNTNTTWVAFTPNINDAICGSVYFYPEIADGRMVYTSFLGTNNKVLALVSIGKDVTSNNTQSATYVWSRVTDGITATATYAEVGTRTTIDLETEYPIEKVILWRYYNDRRLYYKTFVKGYDENDNLQAVFHDYRTDGEYREGDDGEDLPAYTRHISSLEPNTQYWAKFQLRARGTSNWSSEFWRPFVTKPNRIDVVNPQVNNLAEDGGTLQAQSTDYETTDLVSYAIISGKNLFNKNNVKLNTYVDSTTGLEVSPIIKILNKYDLESGNYTGTTGEDITTARPQRVRIPFNKMINIKGASYINISLENPGVMWIEKYTFLDANYSYISGVDPVNSSGTGKITPPANAVYLRICLSNKYRYNSARSCKC